MKTKKVTDEIQGASPFVGNGESRRRHVWRGPIEPINIEPMSGKLNICILEPFQAQNTVLKFQLLFHKFSTPKKTCFVYFMIGVFNIGQ